MTKHLGDLNPQRFFCPICGIGPADNCPGYHVTERPRPVSNVRVIVTAIIGSAIVLVGLWMASRV